MELNDMLETKVLVLKTFYSVLSRENRPHVQTFYRR